MKRFFLLSLAGVFFVVFCSLGSWQLQRRSWKLDLIDQVERQLSSPPVQAPDATEWARLNSDDAYRPVKVRGHFLHSLETPVQAMTAYGSGYWVITPFKTDRGFTVLVNRGFVDPAHRLFESRSLPSNRSSEPQEITGLLRLSEPEGRTIQANEPGSDRWYSRDVQAIGTQRGIPLADLAPYFIDADAVANSTSAFRASKWPVGGLTVVAFRNTHLVYAITWYSLALLCVVAVIIVVRLGHQRTESDE